VVVVPGEKLMGKKGFLSRSSTRDLSDKKLLSAIKPALREKKLQKTKSSPQLLQGFLTMAKLRLQYLHLDRKFKAGVIYFTGGDSEQDLLKNR